MRAGVKVGLLVGTLAAVVAAALWLVGDQDEPDAGTPLPAPSATPPRPRRAPASRHAEKPSAPKDELDSAAESPRTSDKFDLAGEVVDADGKPVAGADVRAIRPDGATGETKTGADGRFALACGPKPRVGSISIGLSATAGPTRAAFLAYELLDDAPDEDDVGQLALAPAIALTARVVDAKGAVAGARVFVGTFFGTVFAAATADAHGVAKFPSTPPAEAWLFAYAKGRGRARGEIPDPRDPKVPLVLTLAAHAVRVLVVRAPPDEPLAGERVTARLVTDADETRLYSEFVPPLDVAPTTADGFTTVEDVGGEETLELRCAAPEKPCGPWRAPRRPAKPVVVEAKATDARIEFPAGRTIRWRIAEGETPPPAEGALVSLKPSLDGNLPPGPPKLLVAKGELVGAGFGPDALKALAEADDGAVASIRIDSVSERGPDAVFRRPRRVDVTLRERGGGPVAGAQIALRTDDNRARPVGESVSTDGGGRASVAGIDPALGRLSVFASSGTPPDVRVLGVVDVTSADAKLDAVLPDVRAVTLRVTTEGERKLPPNWKILVDATWTDSAVGDEATAEIRVSARPHADDGSLRLLLRADGFRDVQVAVPASAATVDASFDRGVTLLADVRGGDGWTPQVWLERWASDANAWRPTAIVQNLAARPDADGRRKIERQAPGRWRLRESGTDVAGAAADVNLGDGPTTLSLDLTRAGFASGRVLGPDDQPVAGASVWFDDPGADAPASSRPNRMIRAMTDGAGAFRVVVPGERTVRVRAWHPLMRGAPGKDFADVVAPRDDVVLRLVAGPTVEFTISPDAAAQIPIRAPTVLLFRGPPTGEPAAQLASPLASRVGPGAVRWRAGGFEPGRYTVWIDVGAAPTVASDVDLVDGPNDLGTIRPSPGSTVRVHVSAPAGVAVPALGVAVVRLDAPVYTRFAALRTVAAGEEIAVPGLGAGRFEVRVNPSGAWREDAFKRTVDLDGERDVVIDYAPK